MPKPRLLIADDNPLSLRFFADALGALASCTLVDDGGKALQAARHQAFDLLLLDARMPILGGAQVLAALRAEDCPSRAVPALATTAEAGADASATLLATGFTAVLPKPIAVESLRHAVARHLPVFRGVRDGLDDDRALAVAGGDAGIVAALRDLLASELEALPHEIGAITARCDGEALRERLHRLDASAGFCGAYGLSEAAATLRAVIAVSGPDWPAAALATFLSDVAAVRRALRPATAPLRTAPPGVPSTTR